MRRDTTCRVPTGQYRDTRCRDITCDVPTTHIAKIMGRTTDVAKIMGRITHDVEITGRPSHVVAQKNQFSKPIPGSISVIIQQYKSSVTRFVKKINNSKFKWQPRFYEHIIRNDQSYEMISEYITNNPKNWKDDDLFQNQHE